jgi:hypothetical protein
MAVTPVRPGPPEHQGGHVRVEASGAFEMPSLAYRTTHRLTRD